MSDKSKEVIPLRTQLKHGLSNFLQKYRTVLIGIVAVIIVVLVGLAIWSQIDASTKKDYASRIEKSQDDFVSWQSESDLTKKETLGRALEDELSAVERNAPVSYGLLKALFLHGNFLAEEKKWSEASKVYAAISEKDPQSYLAPIGMVNASVCQEEAGDLVAALALLDGFLKTYSINQVLAPQVYFTKGHLLELQLKTADALAAYKALLEKYPESNWTKLAHDRIILLGSE
ncbi:MAG: tetratricopeptide repeat protein [Spirochaetales bacterium]